MNHETATHASTVDRKPPTTDTGVAKVRACARNHDIQRRAFLQRARELVPDLETAIAAWATALYGDAFDGKSPAEVLEERLRATARFYDWFAKGKPAKFILCSDLAPDGEIAAQFARCWQAAATATPNLTPRFTLNEEGFRVPLPHGYYRFNRSVLLGTTNDDGRDITVVVDAMLLRRGGLYRRFVSPSEVRLTPMGSAFLRWKLALRMLRHYPHGVRAEIIRRLWADIPFEFARHHGALKITLRGGRMPDELRKAYQKRATIMARRLEWVRNACAVLEANGRQAAEAFAADPGIAAAQCAQDRERAIRWFRDARTRLWQIARECYRTDSLPEWPFRTPNEVRGRARRGITSRQRIRLECAIESFQQAFNDVTRLGWNPLEDPCLTETGRFTVPQRILALAYDL